MKLISILSTLFLLSSQTALSASCSGECHEIISSHQVESQSAHDCCNEQLGETDESSTRAGTHSCLSQCTLDSKLDAQAVTCTSWTKGVILLVRVALSIDLPSLDQYGTASPIFAEPPHRGFTVPIYIYFQKLLIS